MTRFKVTIREGDFWDDGVGWEASAGQPGLAAPERCLVITGSIDEVAELLTRFYLSGVRDERGKRTQSSWAVVTRRITSPRRCGGRAWRSVEYRALEDDCVALVGVINALGGIIDALAREWPEGAALPDDTLERLEHVDQRMDDIYARRQEWRV